MEDNVHFWGMIILMIVFTYVLLSNNIMLTLKNGTYDHVNKAYMALLMGSIMGVIFYLLMIIAGHQDKNVWKGLLIFVLVSVILIILIRKQILVSDEEFLKGMIEHHDMAILMSEKIIEKTDNPTIRNFAIGIIRDQQREINWMKNLLDHE